MHGLSGINIELTSHCNKQCHICGRRKEETDYPERINSRGDMPFEMLERIQGQIPPGVFVQLHDNGEPLLYPQFAEALKLFNGHYVGLDTNGKLLMEKNEAIRAFLSSITISVIPDDPEQAEQMSLALLFLQYQVRPLTVFRLLGHIDDLRSVKIEHWQRVYPKVLIAYRQLHDPEGSFNYEKPVTIPEHGICQEMLHKLAIDRHGNVFPCVRFDPDKKNLLGNVNEKSLDDIWNSMQRRQWAQCHIEGARDLVPLCAECDYWGVPRG